MGNTFVDAYERWISGDDIDEETKSELLEIKDDLREIEDRFYMDLEFGTAGLRGIVGAGTNRMNKYTVGLVTQGLCDFVLCENANANAIGNADTDAKANASTNANANGNADVKTKGIVIARDPRYMSKEFSEESAMIIAANGIAVYLFDDIRPTPLLSFAVRRLGCAAGIVITASHNTSEYNGFKVYGDDGAQMGVGDAGKVAEYAKRVGGYGNIKRISMDEALDSGLLKIVGKDIDDDYIKNIRALSIRGDEIRSSLKNFRMIYTPLHGTGNLLVRRILSEMGFENVIVVPEQEMPNPAFPTVKSPNPESREAFDIAIELAKKENVDIIIGTDPDCDRIGVVFKDYDGGYAALTGNQIGYLLLEYVLSSLVETNTLPKKPFVVKSIVSSRMADIIAERYGVKLYEAYTGFKNICGLVKKLDEYGDERFVYGFEESNGYVAGTFVRDKDAVIAAMLIAEMTAYYRVKGMTLADALKSVNDRYGYTLDEVVSYTLKGKEGLEKITNTMVRLRTERPSAFGDMKVSVTKDYLTNELIDFEVGGKVVDKDIIKGNDKVDVTDKVGAKDNGNDKVDVTDKVEAKDNGNGKVEDNDKVEAKNKVKVEAGGGKRSSLNLEETANMLSYSMEDGSWYIIRPSGTEPKIKLYFGVTGSGTDDARNKMTHFKSVVLETIDEMLSIK